MIKIMLINLLFAIPFSYAAKEQSTFEKINDNPALYNGKEVTINGKVDEIMSPTTVKLDGPGWFSKDMIVVGKSSLSEKVSGILEEGKEITVTGKYYNAPFTNFRQEHNLDFNPQVQEKLKDHQSYLVLEDALVQESN